MQQLEPHQPQAMLNPGGHSIRADWDALLHTACAKFDRLRDAPVHSVQELSHQYQKAFQAFHTLWGFQQTHRRALVESGLRRSDIGEVASKIGHLHFNWYLRCSDTRFLVESYVFYEAIHARQYYEHQDSSLLDSAGNLSVYAGGGAAGGSGAAAEAVAEQQLKYYARFILVCIMLGKKEEAVNLMQEFQALVAAHAMAQEAAGSVNHTGSSTHEWRLVLAEVGCLLMADPGMPLPRSPGAALSFRPCCRPSPTSQEADCYPHVPLIHHAVLVGYHHRQVKLGELPIDILRMMQSLEWQDSRLMCLEGGGEVVQGPPLSAADAALPGSSTDSPHHTTGHLSRNAFADGLPAAGRPAAPPRAASAYMPSITRAASVDLGLMTAPQAAHASATPSSSAQPAAPSPPRYTNPRKTMLYRSTAPAVMSTLHSVAVTMDEDAPQVLLLYLSCSSMKARLAAAAAHASSSVALSQVGNRERPKGPVPALPPVPSTSCLTSSLATTSATSAAARPCHDLSGADLSSAWCLSPPPAGGRAGPASIAHCALRALDLQPLTRHRLFVVVDGDVSGELRSVVGQELGHALVALMSPRHRPSAFGDAGRSGQLLTLFLTLPVSAFCLIMGEADPNPSTLRALQDAVDESLGAIATALGQALMGDRHDGHLPGRSRPAGNAAPSSSPGSAGHSRSSSAGAAASAWALPFQDVLLRQFMCRFVLARAALAYHRASTGRPECQPDCTPDLPDQVAPSTPMCVEAVERVAAVLKRQALFEGHAALVGGAAPAPGAGPLPSGLASSTQEGGQLGAASSLAAASRTSSTTATTQPLPVPGAKSVVEGMAALAMGGASSECQ